MRASGLGHEIVGRLADLIAERAATLEALPGGVDAGGEAGEEASAWLTNTMRRQSGIGE